MGRLRSGRIGGAVLVWVGVLVLLGVTDGVGEFEGVCVGVAVGVFVGSLVLSGVPV